MQLVCAGLRLFPLSLCQSPFPLSSSGFFLSILVVGFAVVDPRALYWLYLFATVIYNPFVLLRLLYAIRCVSSAVYRRVLSESTLDRLRHDRDEYTILYKKKLRGKLSEEENARMEALESTTVEMVLATFRMQARRSMETERSFWRRSERTIEDRMLVYNLLHQDDDDNVGSTSNIHLTVSADRIRIELMKLIAVETRGTICSVKGDRMKGKIDDIAIADDFPSSSTPRYERTLRKNFSGALVHWRMAPEDQRIVLAPCVAKLRMSEVRDLLAAATIGAESFMSSRPIEEEVAFQVVTSMEIPSSSSSTALTTAMTSIACEGLTLAIVDDMGQKDEILSARFDFLRLQSTRNELSFCCFALAADVKGRE